MRPGVRFDRSRDSRRALAVHWLQEAVETQSNRLHNPARCFIFKVLLAAEQGGLGSMEALDRAF